MSECEVCGKECEESSIWCSLECESAADWNRAEYLGDLYLDMSKEGAA